MSLGYRTRVISSALFFSLTAASYSKLLNLSKEEVEDNRRHMGLITDNEFKHYLNKDLSTPEGTNDLIWKEVANGTERIRTSTIVHSDLYQNYKISWEQNSKTGEKRNETKIKWGQPYED